ncbi:MAG: pseudouridine synthase [Victivallales bacterium]
MDKQNKLDADDSSMRLDSFLGKAGVASRRSSADIIRSGRVHVNGNIVTEPGFRITDADKVQVDSKEVEIQAKYYVMLNKPSGYYSTASDPHADKLVIDLVSIPGVRLYTAGRLDRDSEGLIILTNDGDYAAKLTHPKHGILKRYEVTTDRPLSSAAIQQMKQGIISEGENIKAKDVKILRGLDYIFIMGEGKKREVRRLVFSAGARINRLKRVAVGGLNIGSLLSGKWRFLDENDVKSSLKQA